MAEAGENDPHPHDADGRLLPWPSWPRGREAPGALELVRHFCNTVNRENGADRLCDAAGLDAWLVWEGREPLGATHAELERLVAIRESIHRVAMANTRMPDTDLDGITDVADLLSPVRLRVVAADGRLELSSGAVTGGDGRVDGRVDVLIDDLAIALFHAALSGDLARLKACDHCHWVVYDGSKNRGGRWCSMGACGGRENARAYRRRRAL